MVLRIWHGWTTHENADVYESLLRSTIFPGIEAKGIEGYRRIRLLRAELEGDETEFVTIMEFDSFDSVRQFVGEDIHTSYVPQEARRVLKRFDSHSRHFVVTEDRRYGSRSGERIDDAAQEDCGKD